MKDKKKKSKLQKKEQMVVKCYLSLKLIQLYICGHLKMPKIDRIKDRLKENLLN